MTLMNLAVDVKPCGPNILGAADGKLSEKTPNKIDSTLTMIGIVRALRNGAMDFGSQTSANNSPPTNIAAL